MISNSSLYGEIKIVDNEKKLEELENVIIIYSYEVFRDEHVSRYYHYTNKINQRIFSDFCVKFSGGPIYSNANATTSLYGILIKTPCGDDCNIEDNGFKISYEMLSDHLDWINDGEF